jgi:serine/threonine protein kinase
VDSGFSPDDPFQPALNVYSLGAMFYFMLTRRYPFDFGGRATTAEILVHVATRNTIPIEQRSVSMPCRIAAVVEMARQKIPKKRYQNAIEFS